MKKFSMATLIILMGFILIFSRCNSGASDKTEPPADSTQAQAALPAYGGFDSQVEWGKHLVTIGGCNDCHTPVKMGPTGSEEDMDLLLSGQPSQLPPPEINRKEVESKGLMVVGPTSTSFVGPWGVSFAANITSDSTTGIGNLTLDQFTQIFKTGRLRGAPAARKLLPPMPWHSVGEMTDNEFKALYAYLESTKPVHNIVPQPLPPVLAMKK